MNIIRGKLPVSPQPGSSSCIRVDIRKGECFFEKEFDLSELGSAGKNVFICLFTEEHQIDADAIQNENGMDKPYRMITVE